MLNQVSQAEEQRTRLNAVLDDLQKRKQQLEADIDTETRRLLTKQQEEYNNSLSVATKKLGETRVATDAATKELTSIQSKLSEARTTIAEREKRHTELKNGVDRLVVDRTTVQNHLFALKQEGNRLETANQLLRDEAKELAEYIDKAKDDLTSLDDQKVALDATIIDLESTITALSQQKETAESEIVAKIHTKHLQLEELKVYENQTRTDLANREMAIAEREKGIVIRERKADQQEQIIQQNANLLNL